jgi:predicted AAA+ superfamily ATPase
MSSPNHNYGFDEQILSSSKMYEFDRRDVGYGVISVGLQQRAKCEERRPLKYSKQKEQLVAIYQNKSLFVSPLINIQQQTKQKKNNYLPYLQKMPSPRMLKKGARIATNSTKKSVIKDLVDSVVFKF